MPNVTFEQLYHAVYVQAPVSAMYPTIQDWTGMKGTLGILNVRYGSVESRTRQICAFLGEGGSFITSPGIVTQDDDLLVHTYRTDSRADVLREPLRDDLAGEYVNAWRLNGPEVRDSRMRTDFLETIKARWRVLRRAEMGES